MSMRMNRAVITNPKSMKYLEELRADSSSRLVNELSPFFGIISPGIDDFREGKASLSSETTTLRPVIRGEYARNFGEVIDPAIEDRWLRECYHTLPDSMKSRPLGEYREAYHYGLLEKATRRKVAYEKIEEALEDQWCLWSTSRTLQWSEVMPYIRHAYNRPLPFPNSR